MRKVILATTFALALGAAGALMASAATVFFQGFETDTDGWLDNGGTITRVSSGTNGIPSASGDYHAEVEEGVFTRWGGYESAFPVGGYVTSIDIYLDMAQNPVAGTDYRIDFSSAINMPDGTHRRDFVFSIGTDPLVAGQFAMSASNNTPGWPSNPGREPFFVDETGWYTFRHTFQDNGSGVLEVVMEVLDSDGAVLHSWTLSDATDVIGSTVGGNRYGWFVTSEFAFLAVDNSEKLNASATTVVVSGDTADAENQPGWLFNRDPGNATPIEFNTDAASIGLGSLYVEPLTAEAARKFIGELFLLAPIADFNYISYDFLIGPGGTASDANEFYMNVYANFGESPDDKFYDCRYNVVPAAGSTSSFTTVTFDPDQSYPVTTRSGPEASPYTCPASPADMDLDSPGSTIRVIALNMGDSTATDANLDGYFDNVVVDAVDGVTTYDFEPGKDACRSNGWQASTSPVFKNQGDCVQYMNIGR